MTRRMPAALRPRPNRLFLIGPLSALASAGVCLVGMVIPPIATAAECTDTWTGPAEGLWHNSTNWSGGTAPTSSDVACIGSGKTVEIAAGVREAAVVQGSGQLKIKGTLSIESETEPSTIGVLSMESGGEVTGPARLEISESLYWFAGSTMSGSGATVLLPGATATLATISESMQLIGRDLINEGALAFYSGKLVASEGAQIVNSGIFDANSTIVPAISASGGGSFINHGLLKKTFGGGTTELAIPLQSDGAVDAQVGELAFAGGGESDAAAQWESSEGADVRFKGSAFSLDESTVTAAVVVSDACSVEAQDPSGEPASVAMRSGGSLWIDGGTVTIANLEMAYGSVLGGAATVNISGALTWSAESTMSGSGSTVLLPGATASWPRFSKPCI